MKENNNDILGKIPSKFIYIGIIICIISLISILFAIDIIFF